MKPLFARLALLCFLLLCPVARAETVEQVVNPKRASNTWISDMARVLDADDERKMNGVLNGLQRRTGTEMAVVTIRRAEGLDPKPFATALFNRWGIGQRARDNGVLLLLVLDARRVEVETGDGMSRILPDARVQQILTERAVPRFRQGDYSGGVSEAVRALAFAIQNPMGSGAPANKAPSERTGEQNNTRENMPNAPAARLAERSGEPGSGSGVGLAPLAGAALLLPLGGWAFVRSRTRHCPRCKVKMVRLSEAEDDAHLLFDQKFEEDLGSVDYRAWKCPSCSAITLERAVKWLSGHSDCPQCAHRSVTSQTTILRHPTHTRTGQSLIRRHCHFPRCSFRDEERRTLPKIPRPSSSRSSGFRGSSGSFGGSSGSSGSFGGGSSSGGGAGASW